MACFLQKFIVYFLLSLSVELLIFGGMCEYRRRFYWSSRQFCRIAFTSRLHLSRLHFLNRYIEIPLSTKCYIFLFFKLNLHYFSLLLFLLFQVPGRPVFDGCSCKVAETQLHCSVHWKNHIREKFTHRKKNMYDEFAGSFITIFLSLPTSSIHFLLLCLVGTGEGQ